MSNHQQNCMICGAPIVYSSKTISRECAICHRFFPAREACANGHYVCDSCHKSCTNSLFLGLLASEEQDPLALFEQVILDPAVHLHGPEHHIIVPCVLLTAYSQCQSDLDLAQSLGEAIDRAKQVPGGVCGFWGCCGAAIGAGIYMSVLTGATPLKEREWALANLLTSQCLEKISAAGGPRCCKRNARLAIQEAVDFTREHLGVPMPIHPVLCTTHAQNLECIHKRCPFYPHSEVE